MNNTISRCVDAKYRDAQIAPFRSLGTVAFVVCEWCLFVCQPYGVVGDAEPGCNGSCGCAGEAVDLGATEAHEAQPDHLDDQAEHVDGSAHHVREDRRVARLVPGVFQHGIAACRRCPLSESVAVEPGLEGPEGRGAETAVPPHPQVRLDGADDGGPEQPVLGGQSQPAIAIP